MGKRIELLKVWEDTKKCELCDISKLVRNKVFGDGSSGAKLMIVGEAPGDTEDSTGHPFENSAPAGKIFEAALRSAGIDRDEIFITNMLQCHPNKYPNNVPKGNRTPGIEEIRNCFNYIYEKIRLISPQVIVAMGNVAVKYLTWIEFKKMEDIVGKIFNYNCDNRIKVVAAYHPMYMIYNRDKAFMDDYVKVLLLAKGLICKT